MKKHISICIDLHDPSEQAAIEVMKALDIFVEDTEYLLPKASIEIEYIKG
jgi:hypothetical protein